MVVVSSSAWRDSWRVRQLSKRVRAACCEMQGVAIRDPKAMITYLSIPPRTVIYEHLPEKRSEIDPIFRITPTEDEIDKMRTVKMMTRGTADEPKGKYPDGGEYAAKTDLQVLMDLMSKWSPRSSNDFVTRVMRYESPQVKARVEKLYFQANWRDRFTKARLLMQMGCLENDMETLESTWEQNNPPNPPKYHTVEERVYLVARWCTHQGILLNFLVNEVTAVMDRTTPRKTAWPSLVNPMRARPGL
ncbi:uncharacterized protein LOC119733776 [Patiria miniata]|uniref:Uncharacterized protein n=1 Tax=Patiria miniata TaxID=46514 RepID=A0A914AH99_PATMI|nr:uncharacterized protein LOC119733776 [Patiria miniata]